MNANESATLWQRAEMLRGITQSVDHQLSVLEMRLRYGTEEVPSDAAKTTTEARPGLSGALEDVYDDISQIEQRIIAINMRIGQRGEGPRGELATPRPERETGIAGGAARSRY